MTASEHTPVTWWGRHMWDGPEYFIDAVQRTVLFTDILRKRGNQYLEHISEGQPPVLTFDYEILIDGRTLKQPVNYALARIRPDEGVTIDPAKRPIVVIDPRAGHGPGIGGSKKDSQIGIAASKGHPVYFVLFYPQPEPGQTLNDVKQAQALFVEHVSKLHPQATEDPAVIGNCQAGWAIALLGADRPDVTGPLVLNGSPLSYWSGERGKNRMRCRGGLMGGVWVALLLSDLGNGTFDGANLVMNFESLNPANTLWTKQYNVYSRVDTEEKRYLDFEKWWNGYFDMTSEEIRFIVRELFVGNKLTKGEVTLEDKINLKNIEDPMLMFASSGDNITPPLQALSWIPQVYPTTEDIRRHEKVIVYLLHKEVGHLGIFVSGNVAKKEHTQIIGHLDMIEYLPPGLYEMVIEEGDTKVGITDYNVRYESREVDDIRAMDDGIEDEEAFPAAAAISDINEQLYDSLVSPWVKMGTTKASAELMRQTHPLRVSRYFFSDLNPGVMPCSVAAPIVKENRRSVSAGNIFHVARGCTSEMIVNSLNYYKKLRDDTVECAFNIAYDNPWAHRFAQWYDAVFNHADHSEVEELQAETLATQDRERWLSKLDQGGFAEGIARILVWTASADQVLHPGEFQVFKERVQTLPELSAINGEELKRIVREQSRIVQTYEDQALEALPTLLTTPEQRVEALKIAEEMVLADGEEHPDETVRLQKIRAMLAG